MRLNRALVLPLLSWSAAATAHGCLHPAGSSHPAWTSDPLVVGPLVLTLAWFLVGFTRLHRRAGSGRPELQRRFFLFVGGWLVLALSLVSPLHEAGERSFTLHMVEHELIMLPAALMLALSKPIATMMWALPRTARQALGATGHAQWIAEPWRWLTAPVTATAIQGAAMWLWHAPPLFDRALRYPGWHVVQHLSFLFSALLFWWGMVTTRNRPAAALCLFVTSVIGGALGALMALSSSPWYEAYAAMPMMPFGLTPTEDQQLAGLVMWIPGGLVHAGAALLLLHRLLSRAAA